MDRLAIITAESQRFADVLSRTAADRHCPTCPDWTAADLLWHLTEVHLFWAAILQRRVLSESEIFAVEAAKPSRPETMADLLALRERATADLVHQLTERDDAEPCWSWWPPDQTVGFTRRMQTYEATMHRVDAELTAAVPVSPIADDVAAGAVDHVVDVMWGWMPDGAAYRTEAVVEFVAADTGQRWLVEAGRWSVRSADGDAAEGPRANRAHSGAPSATVTAPVVDLALWAWTRDGTVHISGAPESVCALNSVVAQGIP